jgi:hypothetical protein
MASEELRNLMDQVMKTNDPELMKMLTQLLQQQAPEGSTGNAAPTQEEIKKAQTQYPEFVMNSDKEDKVGGVPVNRMPRSNSFKDTGADHKDEPNQTPTIKPVERRRPKFTKVEQTCSRCSKSVKVHPQHAREFYVCDKCLRR